MKVKFGLPLILLLALALLVSVAGCGSDTGTQDSATADEQAVIDKFVAAHPPTDREALAAIWTEDAVLDDYMTNITCDGRDQIVGYVSQMPTISWQLNGEPIKVGGYIVQPVTYSWGGGNPSGQGVHVFEITGDGLIKHLWWSGG